MLVKSLDDQKSNISAIPQLFSNDFQQKRLNLSTLCQDLMLNDVENIGKKSREILWRKAYYDIVSLAKRILSKTDPKASQQDDLILLEGLLKEGITTFKKLILTFEHKFDLGLKDTIDLNPIKNPIMEIPVFENQHHTMEEISYAWDVVHGCLMSIGDLYRYHIGFGMLGVKDDIVAFYYNQAFKLNPSIGMAQNQLGTLYAGKNYEIDSIFHYLYALSCKIPFELSENNVNKIFQKNALFLESNEPNGCIEPDTKIKYFIARFILVIDIFYYDKDVTDFTDLCHSILIDLKYLLDGGDRGFLSSDVLFKMTAILIFCMHKLKQIGSKKAHSMNALLVALVSELVDCCNRSCEQFISSKEAHNIIFYDRYNRIFTQFENFVRGIRSGRNGKDDEIAPATIIQKHVVEPNEEAPIFIETGSDDRNSSSNKENNSHENVKDTNKKVSKEKSTKKRRRRRRQMSNNSDTDSESDAQDSDLDGSESEVSFSSYDEDDSDVSSDWSEEEEEEVRDDIELPEKPLSVPIENGLNCDSDSGDEIIVLEEEIIYPDEQSDTGIDVFKATSSNNDIDNIGLVTEFNQLSGIKFRKAYRKIDPNIILEFCTKEKSLKALKLLFDWMYLNGDIVVGCYVSNPELIHKIMRLVNFLNIDIFTRKVYFDRSFLTFPGMRTDLRYLFDIRRTIPIEEDEELKRFILLESVQQGIDWELASKLDITDNEMSFLRLFKLVDYGFHLSKMRKFHYYFCAKERIFIERSKKERDERNGDQRRDRKRRGNRRGRSNRNEDGSKRNGERRRRNRRNRNRSPRRRKDKKNFEEKEKPIEVHTIAKRYLRNKLDQNSSDEGPKISQLNINETNEGLNGKTTHEKMGELWLRNEVKSLESKVSI